MFGISYEYRKVLGINWDTDTDRFIFEFNEIINIVDKMCVTKRNISKNHFKSHVF